MKSSVWCSHQLNGSPCQPAKYQNPRSSSRAITARKAWRRSASWAGVSLATLRRWWTVATAAGPVTVRCTVTPRSDYGMRRRRKSAARSDAIAAS